MAFNQRLIAEVRKRRILFDVTHPHFRSKKKKDKVWMEVGQKLGTTGIYVRKRWKNLRDTYTKYLKHCEGKPGTSFKNKKWQWADKMEVFRPYMPMNIAASDTDVNCESVDWQLSESTSNFEDNQLALVVSNSKPETWRWEDTQATQNPGWKTPELEVVSSTDVIVEGNRAGRKPDDSGPGTKPDDSVTITSVEFPVECFESKKTSEMDATDLLFLAHARTVKKFSRKRQAVTKMKIAQIIMEQEILHDEEMLGTEHADKNFFFRPVIENNYYNSYSDEFSVREDSSPYPEIAHSHPPAFYQVDPDTQSVQVVDHLGNEISPSTKNQRKVIGFLKGS